MTQVGIDLLEIERLERAIERRPALAARLFTPGELEASRLRARPGQHLAARFCAKEAATKALRLEVFRPLDFEVEAGGGDGAPTLRLHGAARDRAREMGLSVSLSLTHTRGMAGAVVVAS